MPALFEFPYLSLSLEVSIWILSGYSKPTLLLFSPSQHLFYATFSIMQTPLAPVPGSICLLTQVLQPTPSLLAPASTLLPSVISITTLNSDQKHFLPRLANPHTNKINQLITLQGMESKASHIVGNYFTMNHTLFLFVLLCAPSFKCVISLAPPPKCWDYGFVLF